MVHGLESNLQSLHLKSHTLLIVPPAHHATLYKIVHQCQLLITLFYYVHSVKDGPKMKLKLRTLMTAKGTFLTTKCSFPHVV